MVDQSYDPTVAVPVTATIEPELSMAQLLEEASQDMSTQWVEGNYKLRLTEFGWHYNDNDKALGLINTPRGGCAKFTFTVTEGPGNTTGKTYNKYFHFKSGTTNGFRWDGEKDLIKWLIKQGVNVLTHVKAVADATGVRDCKATYSPIGVYIAAFGGDYELKMTPKKAKPEELNENWVKCALLFDDQGNQLQKPMPVMPGSAAPVVEAVPAQAPVAQIPVVAQQPVVPVAAIPVAEVPTALPVQPQAVAQVPVQQPTALPVQPVVQPVVETPVPVQPVALPVAEAHPVEQALAQVPTGLPAGLPGLPTA